MKKLVIILISIILTSSLYSAEWVRKPKLKLGIRNSYDSNILKVSSERDSNRIKGISEQFIVRYRFWSKFSPTVKMFHSVRANYLLLPGSTYANRWDISYKTKLGLRLFRKGKQDIFPTTRLYVLFDAGYSDKYYSDRALGEENIINVSNVPINLKDLFDNFSVQTGPQLEFTFSKALSINFEYIYKSSDYKNITEPSVNYDYSLDNTQTEFKVEFTYLPIPQLELSPYFGKIHRTYQDKFARSLAGQTITGQKREYTYSDLGIDLKFAHRIFTFSAGFESTKRKDGYEGYYDYDYSKFYGKLAISLNENSSLVFYLNHAKKDYSNLTLSGQLLKNTYDYYKLEYEFPFMTSMIANVGFIYDKESSSYFKYNYKRWIPYFSISYQFSE